MRLGDEEVAWTVNAVSQLHQELGAWDRVAAALADPRLGPHRLKRSPSAWFQIVQKGKCNRPKANALRAYYGLLPFETNRTAIPVTRINRDRLRSTKLKGESWDDYLMRLWTLAHNSHS